jgi:hypothetical protein
MALSLATCCKHGCRMRVLLLIGALAISGCGKELHIANEQVAAEEEALSRLFSVRETEVGMFQRQIDSLELERSEESRMFDKLHGELSRFQNGAFDSAKWAEFRELESRMSAAHMRRDVLRRKIERLQWEIVVVRKKHAPAIAAQESQLATARAKRDALAAPAGR